MSHGESHRDSPQPSVGWLVLAFIGVLLVGVAWLFTYFAAAFSCSLDNSVCAENHSERQYHGRLFDYKGRPASISVVVFSSRLYGGHRDRVLTDEQGRFCLSAFSGSGFYVAVEGQTHVSDYVVRSSAPVDPRFADPAVLADVRRDAHEFPVNRRPIMVAEPYPGGAPTSAAFRSTGTYQAVGLWHPATDTARNCQPVSATLAWYRFEDHRRSWQYMLLTLAPIAAAAIFLVALVAETTARWKPSAAAKRTADGFLQATCAVAALTLALTVALWIP